MEFSKIDTTDQEIEDFLADLLDAAGVVPSTDLLGVLSSYLRELAFWNRRVNLTGLDGLVDMAGKHVGDTLTLLQVLPERLRTVLDIGTGAGVPGLVLKLLRPEYDMVLVDAVRKKVSFLRAVSAQLGLKGLWVEHGRVGSGNVPTRRPAEGFDLTVSQAVGSLLWFARLAEPLLAHDGLAVAMKGPRGREELEQAQEALADSGWQAEAFLTRVPLLGHERTLILLRQGKGRRWGEWTLRS